MLKRWIIERQFGRRNLTPFQRAELALLLKPIMPAEAKKRQGTRSDLPTNIVPILAQCPINGKTRDSITEKAGISHGSLDKADFISQHADEQTKQKLRAGDSSINAEYRRLKKEIGQAERTESSINAR